MDGLATASACETSPPATHALSGPLSHQLILERADQQQIVILHKQPKPRIRILPFHSPMHASCDAEPRRNRGGQAQVHSLTNAVAQLGAKMETGRFASGRSLSATDRKRYTIRFATPDSAYISRCGADLTRCSWAPPGTAGEQRGRVRICTRLQRH
jgi:hypothetical protein